MRSRVQGTMTTMYTGSKRIHAETKQNTVTSRFDVFKEYRFIKNAESITTSTEIFR